MKPQTQFYIISSLLFGILFYGEGAGINHLLFALAITIFSVCINKRIWKTHEWKIAAVGYIVASFFTMYYSNALSITMSILSFFIFMIVQQTHSTSFISALFLSLFKILASFVFILLDTIKNKINTSEVQALKPKKKTIGIIVVLGITLLFLSLYRSINPVFDEFFNEFFVNIEWGWIGFFILGLVLFYAFFFPPQFLKQLQAFEGKFSKNINQEGLQDYNTTVIGKAMSFKNEVFSGILLLSILNLLILFLNITDFNFVFLKAALPEGISYSDYVHNGVGAIIFTVICTIAIISFFFRGHLNFSSAAKPIKVLTYFWILQNILLIIMAAFKNELYILEYTLTYKRIGVYFYLIFSAIGLLIAAYKVYSKKDFWVLFKQGSMAFYIMLILACSVNWSRIVTEYNIEYSTNVDYYYLTDLNFENYPLLYDLGEFEDSYYRNTAHLKFGGELKSYRLSWKLADFLEEYEEDSFISYSYGKQKVYNYFKELALNNKLPTYDYNDASSVIVEAAKQDVVAIKDSVINEQNIANEINPEGKIVTQIDSTTNTDNNEK